MASLVTIEAAGRALGVSRSTVWRMIQRGTLPSTKHRGRRMIRAAALKTGRKRTGSKGLPAFTSDHPIFRLVGAGRGGGRTPGARDKHAILDE